VSDREIIDVVDDAGDVIKTITREEAERDNHIIENVIVFVFNSLGKVWIQKRPTHKKHYPGLWDVSACGAILTGEKPLAAARREQLEEMGFESKLQKVETFMNEFPDEDGSTTRRRLSHLFIGISEEIPQPNEEVDEFLVLPHAELKQRVTDKPGDYIPSFLIELDKAVEAYESQKHENN